MRVAISGFLIFIISLCSSCISVKGRVAYDQGVVRAKSPAPTITLVDVPPLKEADLPQVHPCHLDKLALCPPPEVIKAISTPLDCNAPDPSKTPAVAQKSLEWCWATSAEATTRAHDKPVPQCEGVNKVLGRGDCCEEVGPNKQSPAPCHQPGYPYQVFNKVNFYWDWVKGPLSESSIGGQLCKVGPIIHVLEFDNDTKSKHTVVVRNIRQVGGGWEMEVHDHSWNLGPSQEVTGLPEFALGGGDPTDWQFWPMENYKNLIFLGMPLKSISSFVQIRPQP